MWDYFRMWDWKCFININLWKCIHKPKILDLQNNSARNQTLYSWIISYSWMNTIVHYKRDYGVITKQYQTILRIFLDSLKCWYAQNNVLKTIHSSTSKEISFALQLTGILIGIVTYSILRDTVYMRYNYFSGSKNKCGNTVNSTWLNMIKIDYFLCNISYGQWRNTYLGLNVWFNFVKSDLPDM